MSRDDELGPTPPRTDTVPLGRDREAPALRPQADEKTLAGGLVDPQPSAAPAPGTDVSERYDDQGSLGTGGMGDVRLCRDAHIGRRVALKMIRRTHANRPRTRARFVREARVQGQLEHPSIVPVYDIGRSEDGRDFFTMKRLAGQTLSDVIRRLRQGDPETKQRFSLRALVAAFSRVCLAVDYAHERGVLHRDIKPANVMFGDFGEVYILDWGLAKVANADEIDSLDGLVSGDAQNTDAATLDGELLGTPGYMSPEQIDGRQTELDARGDVYSLGAILFELLTYEPLHPRDTTQRAIGSTVSGADARAHLRAPARDVPPELETICIKATEFDPEDRYASARAMHEAVEAFLDGDRDVALRRELAESFASRAAKAATEALRAERHKEEDARSRALGLVSRALALDPDHALARETLVRLLTTPPSQLPRDAAEELDDARRGALRSALRGGAVAFGAWLASMPVLFAMGVRTPWLVAAIVVLIALGVLVSVAGARAKQPEQWAEPAALIISTATLVVFSRILGPFVLIPGLAAANAVSFSINATGLRRRAYVAIAATAVVIPAAAEWLSIVPASYSLRADGLLISPHLTDLPLGITLILMAMMSLAVIILPSLLISRTRDELHAERTRLALHAWQLKQLVKL